MSEQQAVARLSAETMWAGDHASQTMGMAILAVGPGTATLGMTIAPAMINGHGVAHGGTIFTLADSAFAYACNTYGERTVAAHCAITFIKPGASGAYLVATAREISRAGRSGLYDVIVSADGVLIAAFRGHSRSVGGSFLPAPPATT